MTMMMLVTSARNIWITSTNATMRNGVLGMIRGKVKRVVIPTDWMLVMAGLSFPGSGQVFGQTVWWLCHNRLTLKTRPDHLRNRSPGIFSSRIWTSRSRMPHLVDDFDKKNGTPLSGSGNVQFSDNTRIYLAGDFDKKYLRCSRIWT